MGCKWLAGLGMAIFSDFVTGDIGAGRHMECDERLKSAATKKQRVPMTLLIELPDDQAAALQAKAAAEGLSLAEWIGQMAEQAPTTSVPHRHIADVICENMEDVPPEIMATMPEDGASQHDHYIYGWPKREE